MQYEIRKHIIKTPSGSEGTIKTQGGFECIKINFDVFESEEYKEEVDIILNAISNMNIKHSLI